MSGRTELPSGLVTFMFTDIEGSTRLARMLGDDYGSVLGDHRAVMRAAFRDYGGVELFTEGDSFFVAFGDACAALAAAVEAQRRLSAHDWSYPDVAPRVRIGMHTGWAKPNGSEYASIEVHRAARVAAAAHGGQIICSAATALKAQNAKTPRNAQKARNGKTENHQLLGVPVRQIKARNGTAVATRTTLDLLDLGRHRLRGFDDDEQLYQVMADGLERDFPRPRTTAAPIHNLPAPLTSFVGRRAELAELADLLTRHRLVTVAGPGGAGKTRLSLAVAERSIPAYGEGVWNVDAASAKDGLIPAIAAALGVRAEPGRPLLDTLLDHCAGRHMLIVLQTCEIAQASGATAVRQLLAACPGVDLLVTSRAPLGVHGELVWRIPPLSPADVFALLSERADAARGGRPGPGDDGTDLDEVAKRLEGSPLAVELAAARLRLFTAGQLATRLDDPIQALDPATHADADRHDSLEANLDWSYRTLTARGAELLRRLAVFAGPVELGTVEWCGPDALGALSELADKSLVEVVPGPRYRMSGQVRAYASRRLTAAGDERDARDRHVEWSLHTLDSVAVDTDGQPRTVSLTELAPYVAEWQTALRWTANGGSVRAGLRLATALQPWWREHGSTREGRDLLFRLYRRLDGAEIEAADLATAYLVHAGLADDHGERTRFLERAERVARADDRPDLLVRALAGHRATLLATGRWEEAERLCREVITLAEQTGVPRSALPAVIALAELLWRRDAIDEAAELLGSARQLEAGRPQDRGRRTVDWLLGMVALRRRDLVAAHDHLVVALRSRLRHGFSGAAADAVAAIAVRCAQGGDPATAAVLFGGAEAARGARRTEMFGRFWSAQQLSLRVSMGDVAFDAAYADGVGQGFDQIVALALAVEHPDLEDGAARFAQTLR
ncbi:adenylate/guanylate cyclase domain-containing protein [Actinoplanes sp. TBRC 11911]|uniref:adenylate/guanylate cyclase domain-containing protein n=1 Tax=Actinoplanes sp. TBRC 11911 TaxID=2729386 RepID=UPI00145E3D2A|nr:adenylate/guanylate cyclase domain-containing protein [Actinoplanes sp. TBRC 11911]NMO50245.1 adenylate/guanylate cyclase domain-containing protein [Actinoplanes sp. TBRC 11911]